jgi:hypothetical protein
LHTCQQQSRRIGDENLPRVHPAHGRGFARVGPTAGHTFRGPDLNWHAVLELRLWDVDYHQGETGNGFFDLKSRSQLSIWLQWKEEMTLQWFSDPPR